MQDHTNTMVINDKDGIEEGGGVARSRGGKGI